MDKADRVLRGQLLAELDSQVERAALALSEARAEAEAEIELLRQTLRYNTRRKQRNKQLHARRAVPDQVLDEVNTEQRLAQLRLRQALENHEIARLEVTKDRHELDRRNVRSPIDGVVVERHKTAGEYVEGDPIVRLAQLDPLRVELVAPIAMLNELVPGTAVTVYSEFDDDRPYRAEVTRIDPIVDAATATFGIRLELPNPDGVVLPGLKCRVVLDGGVTAQRETQDAAATGRRVAVAPRMP